MGMSKSAWSPCLFAVVPSHGARIYRAGDGECSTAEADGPSPGARGVPMVFRVRSLIVRVSPCAVGDALSEQRGDRVEDVVIELVVHPATVLAGAYDAGVSERRHMMGERGL